MAHAKRYRAALNLFLAGLSSDRQNEVRIIKVYAASTETGGEPDIKIDFVLKEREGYTEKIEFDRGFASQVFNWIRDDDEFIRLVYNKRRRFTVVVRPRGDDEEDE